MSEVAGPTLAAYWRLARHDNEKGEFHQNNREKCTMAKWMIAPALALLLLAQPANPARAEVTELRMATQFGIGAIRNLPNIEVLNISNTKTVDLAPVARWQKP
ncbi:MAG: hypothetical protein ACJ8FV_05080, partial [Xanthobacteraceae bacterium]